jgi:hypothetical protein
MKFRSTALLTLTAATTSVALLAAPAMAEPFADYDTLTVGDYEWRISTDNFGFDEVDITSSGTSDAFDVQNFAILGPDSFNQSVTCTNADLVTDDATGDQVLSCDTETLLGLGVTTSIRIAAAGDLARYFVSITNNTTDPINFGSQYYADLGDGEPYLTASGDATADSDDTWSVNDQVVENDLDNGIAWGLAGAADVPFLTEQQGPSYTITDIYTLAAGDTLNLAYYHLVAPMVLGISITDVTGTTTVPEFAAAVAAEYSTFDGRLVNGLAAGTVVANWGTVAGEAPAPTNTPQPTATAASAALAATGVDGSVPALGALLLLISGLVFVGLRRRTAARSN